MAVDVGSVAMDVVWDVPKMSKDLEKAAAKAADKAAPTAAKAFDEKLSSASKKAEGLGKKLTVGFSLPVAAGLALATKSAADLEQAVGGTGAVFKAQSGKIDAFAKSAADSVGLSEKAARELTSQIGGALKGYGFSVDQAAAKSIQLTQIGADLAATYGGSTADAVEALGAALRGEFDPLERFGIAVNQTLIDQKAVSLGLSSNTANVSQNARANAALALIMERSADAQGQFAREANTASGAAERASARAENAAADLGKAFLPIYTRLSEGTGALAQKFAALPEGTQSAAAGLAVAAVAAGPLIFGLGKLGSGMTSVTAAGAKLDSVTKRNTQSFMGQTSSVSGLTSVMGGALAVAGAFVAMQQRNAEIVNGLVSGLSGPLQQAASSGDWDVLQTKLKDLDGQIANLQEQGTSRQWFQVWDADATAQADAAREGLEQTRAEMQKTATESERLAAATGSTKGEALAFLTTQRASGREFKTIAEAAAAYRDQQKKVGDGAQQTGAQLEQLREKSAKFGQSLFGAADAQKAYQNSLKGIQDAYKTQRDAQQRVTDAQRSYQQALRSVSDAEEQRRQSLDKVRDAADQVREAQRKLNEALAGPTSDDQLSIDRAQLNLERAQKTLKEGGFKDPLEQRSAELDVRSAQADLARINQEIADRVPEAEANLADAQDNLAQSQRDAITAARDVADAQVAVKDASREVAGAQTEAADTANAVRDAQDDAARAAFDLDQKQGDLAGTFNDSAVGSIAFLDSLQRLKELYPQVAGAIDPYIKKVQELQNQQFAPRPEDIASAVGATPPPIAPIRQRAKGGSVWPGDLVNYNETGQWPGEALVSGGKQYLLPTQPGKIIPADKVAAKGGLTIEHLEVSGQDRPQETASEIRRQLLVASVHMP